MRDRLINLRNEKRNQRQAAVGNNVDGLTTARINHESKMIIIYRRAGKLMT